MLCLKDIDKLCSVRFALGNNVVDRCSESCLDSRCILGIALDEISDDADDKALNMLVCGSFV